MIANEQELQVTLERIARFQRQVSTLRVSENDPADYHASASGFLAEIDRIARSAAGDRARFDLLERRAR